jgi:AcrR family transcriptional regulator
MGIGVSLYAQTVPSLPDPLDTAPIANGTMPREVRQAHRRRAILEAAIEVFAKRGYQATTVEGNLVPAARVSIGTFYQHFADKEECFLAAFDLSVEEAQETIVAKIPAAPWSEQVLAGLTALLEEIAVEPLRARVVLVEATAAGPAALARYQAMLEAIAPALARGREFAPAAADLPPTLEVSTLGGLLWVLQQRLMEVSFRPSRRLRNELAGVVAGPYLGDAATRRLLSH